MTIIIIIIMAVHILSRLDIYYTCTGSSGSITFANVPLRDGNKTLYTLRVVGRTADGVRTVIRRRVRIGESTKFQLYC